MILHGYFRSSAAWRVRIALGLKGLKAEDAFHHLRKGEHREASYLAVNPQGLVPALTLDDGSTLTQSLAICEYLDEIAPEPPLLPGDPVARAQIRAFCQVIACDIHPVQNLRVLQWLKAGGASDADAQAWAQRVIATGFDALERLCADRQGPFAFGETPTLADVFLIPQIGNARRFGVEMCFPRLQAIDDACRDHPAFAAAVPDRQPDAE